jgi:AcrR family transcriptional regulator
VDESATQRPTGRRSRKVQRTRSVLTRSALDLFAERGFDNVTVTDIANRADVDPSTFFRHFRSKESVLFTDMDMYVARIRDVIHQRPLDEPILDTLHAVTLELVTTDAFDNELEDLRAELTQSSAELIGERLGIDHQNDPRPYLLATVWLAAGEWLRRRHVSVHPRTVNAPESVDEVVAMIRSASSQLLVGRESTTPH